MRWRTRHAAQVLRRAAPGVAFGVVLVAALAVPARRRRRREKPDIAFRLRAGAPPADELRRVAHGRVLHAIAALDGSAGLDPVTAVHETRKDLKRLRALVRLSGPALGDTVSRREAAAFRDAGRMLSATRDQAVLVQTLDATLQRDPRELPAKRYAKLRAELAAGTGAEPADGAGGPAVLVALRDAGARIEHWELPADPVDPLREGFEAIYARGRRGFRKARANPTAANLHEWRKRVKDLWYAAGILREAGPGELDEVRREARELSELLGEDHDLWVLHEAVLARRGSFARGRHRKALLRDIDRRRARLLKRALRIGDDLYARKPARATARLGKGWKRRLAHR